MNPLWLCLRFPRLSLDISQRGLPRSSTASTALAIIEKQQIFLASALAEQAGVQSGMSLNSAWALLPSLSTVERQPLREQRAVNYLANWAYQFTPAVSYGDNNTLLLEVGGSLRLFQGLENLLAKLDEGLKSLGFQYQLGLAHTPKAAELLPYGSTGSATADTSTATVDTDTTTADADTTTADAGTSTTDTGTSTTDTGTPLVGTAPPYEARACIQALRILPLQKLIATEGLSDKLLKKLQRVGLATLGELLDLPRASVGKRFGKALPVFLQELCGESPDPRPMLSLRPEFDSELHFLSGLTSFDMIRLPITQLLQELQGFLIQRQLSCRGLRWRFFHFDRQASLLNIELSRPQQRWESFFKLSELKLEQISLESVIESVQLYTDNLLPVEAESQGLFKELCNTSLQDANFLVDKLTNRLGAERLYKLQIQNENLPELQQKKTLASSVPSKNEGSHQEVLCGFTPPLWLCEQAQAISLRNKKLYYQGPLDLISPPRRFDSHWWQLRQRRDYFIARHPLGSQYWVYFDHHCKRWFLHGIYG